MSTYAFYHKVSPDPLKEGCQISHLAEDGIAFPTIDVDQDAGETLFIGRTVLYEALGALLNLKPDEIKKLGKAAADLKDAKARIAELERDLKRWADWAQKAEDLGMVVNPL